MMCHNSPNCTSLIPWMHKSQHALQLWVLRALLYINQLWRGYNRCCMIITHVCNVSNKSWTCPHTTCFNGKLLSGSTTTLTSDATMLLPPPKWLWRAPKSWGKTHLRVSQSQVAESWDLEERQNSRKG
jgi:hypothetical protein